MGRTAVRDSAQNSARIANEGSLLRHDSAKNRAAHAVQRGPGMAIKILRRVDARVLVESESESSLREAVVRAASTDAVLTDADLRDAADALADIRACAVEDGNGSQ